MPRPGPARTGRIRRARWGRFDRFGYSEGSEPPDGAVGGGTCPSDGAPGALRRRRPPRRRLLRTLDGPAGPAFSARSAPVACGPGCVGSPSASFASSSSPFATASAPSSGRPTPPELLKLLRPPLACPGSGVLTVTTTDGFGARRSDDHSRAGRGAGSYGDAACSSASPEVASGGSSSSSGPSSRTAACLACFAAFSARRRSRQCSTSTGGIVLLSSEGQSKAMCGYWASRARLTSSSNAGRPTFTPGGVRYQ